MKNLRVIQLNNNDLGALPPVISLLPRLETLHATNNRISSLPESFNELCACLSSLRFSPPSDEMNDS
jgi:Leucine-rich repeat (LRR) protein